MKEAITLKQSQVTFLKAKIELDKLNLMESPDGEAERRKDEIWMSLWDCIKNYAF